MLPRVWRFIAAFAKIRVIPRAWSSAGVQAIIALIRLEAAFGHMHTNDRSWRDAERFHALKVGRHVGLADQHVAYANVLQMIAERRLSDTQRPAVPVRAVRTHVTPGVETHARRAADRRLHVGV